MKEIRTGVRDLGDIERRAFDQLSAAVSHVSDELSNLASVMEWGFEELKWELQQQTAVLLTIDHTLKNPSQTQAHEWRRMAEQLRERGCLREAEQWFQKALAQNPLDYRTYVGLAMVYLRSNDFDKAKDLLERSLPHAPKHEGTAIRSNPLDYRSLSYRLIGRIYAAKEDWANAAVALRTAIDLSPDYADANYEYAQYCVQSGDSQGWIAPLRKATMHKPAYWYMSHAERNFGPVRKDLAILLSGPTKTAVDAIAEAQRALQAADQAILQLPAQLPAPARRLHKISRSIAYQKLAHAISIAASADDSAVVKAVAEASEVMSLALQVKKRAIAATRRAGSEAEGCLTGACFLCVLFGFSLAVVVDSVAAETGALRIATATIGFPVGGVAGIVLGLFLTVSYFWQTHRRK
jgi:tetratricopeptide (TPR) repeat protein